MLQPDVLAHPCLLGIELVGVVAFHVPLRRRILVAA